MLVRETDEDASRKSKLAALGSGLERLASGHDSWAQYQRLVADIIEELFVPPLANPRYESSDGLGRNRRDIVLENNAADGFWSHVRERYSAEYVVVDAKNDSKPIGKASVVAFAHYLKVHGCGLFGILATRLGPGKAAAYAAREVWISERKLILILNDEDLRNMLTFSAEGGTAEDVLRRRVMEFRLSL